MPEASIFLTGPEVLARYRITPATLWRWEKGQTVGFPTPLRISRRKLYRLTDLEAWEAAQSAKVAA